jgi:anti-sigma regulatory factor (Ser/Thr protein kinase)
MIGREATARHPTGVAQEFTDRSASAARAGGFWHTALLYRDRDEYLSGLAEFSGIAAARQAPLQAMLPRSSMPLARTVLPFPSRRTLIADMTEVGRNPARVIPAGQSYADEYPGERVYCLWEPAWPSRSPAELTEVARHEALCNLAFADRAMTLLCLYDAGQLSPELITAVERTHPVVISAGQRQLSSAYRGAGILPSGSDDPLPPPGPDAESLRFTDHLAAVREFTARHANAAGLSPARTRDLILAASEIAANALGHAQGGVVRAWRSGDELICQIEDSGHIIDPLAGRRRQPPDSPGGHGLWLVNLVCDLVQRRSSAAGTVTRMHMRLGG